VSFAPRSIVPRIYSPSPSLPVFPLFLLLCSDRVQVARTRIYEALEAAYRDYYRALSYGIIASATRALIYRAFPSNSYCVLYQRLSTLPHVGGIERARKSTSFPEHTWLPIWVTRLTSLRGHPCASMIYKRCIDERVKKKKKNANLSTESRSDRRQAAGENSRATNNRWKAALNRALRRVT